MTVPKTFVGGERLFAADLNDNFDYVEDSSNLLVPSTSQTNAPWGIPFIDGGEPGSLAAFTEDVATAVASGLDNAETTDASVLTTGTLSLDRLPFRYAFGRFTPSQFPGPSANDTAITFPAGRFSTTPRVIVGMESSGTIDLFGVALVTNSATSTGFSIRRANGRDSPQTIGAQWFAII